MKPHNAGIPISKIHSLIPSDAENNTKPLLPGLTRACQRERKKTDCLLLCYMSAWHKDTIYTCKRLSRGAQPGRATKSLDKQLVIGLAPGVLDPSGMMLDLYMYACSIFA